MDSDADRLSDALAANSPIGVAALAAELGWAYGKTYRHLRELHGEGLAFCKRGTGTGSAAKPSLWFSYAPEVGALQGLGRGASMTAVIDALAALGREAPLKAIAEGLTMSRRTAHRQLVAAHEMGLVVGRKAPTGRAYLWRLM